MIEPNDMPLVRAAVLELAHVLAQLPLLDYLAVYKMIEGKGPFIDAQHQKNFELMCDLAAILYEAQQKIREVVTNVDSSPSGGIITL